MKRVWLDTVVAAQLENAMETMDKLINEGYTLIVANTAVDITVFQENPEWFEDHLLNDNIIIEIWDTPDQMVKKPFFWSSCQLTSEPAATLEEALKDLPNGNAIIAIANLVNKYGIAKGDWPAGQWAPPEPITPAVAKVLGLTEAATRTEVLNAAKAIDRLDLFSAYNVGYTKGIAMQHLCTEILNCDGSTTEI